LAVSVSASF